MTHKNYSHRGNFAESLVKTYFLRHGFEVYQTSGEQAKFDMVVHREDVGLKTIQVKSTSSYCTENSRKVCLSTTYFNKKLPLSTEGLDYLVVVLFPEEKLVFFEMDGTFKNTHALLINDNSLKKGKYLEKIS